MRIELGMRVWTEDDQEAGTISRFLLDQRQVARGLALRTGALFGHEVLVDEAEFIIEGDRVRLRYRADELDALPDVESVGQMEELPAGDEATTYRAPEAPFVYGAGVPATPPLASGPGADPSLGESLRTERNEALVAQAREPRLIGKGTTVESNAGERLGEVTRAGYDATTGALSVLVIQTGGLLGQEREIDPATITSVGMDSVRLY